MNRQQIVESLRQQGFSAKTLMNFTDKQLSLLSNKILGEAQTTTTTKTTYITSDPNDKAAVNALLDKASHDPNILKGKNIEVKEEKKKDKWIQKATNPKKKGQLHKDLDVPQDEKIPVSKLKSAAKKGGKVGKRAQMALNMQGIKENKEISEWVDKLVKKQYHPMVTKNELMETLAKKLNEKATVIPMPAKAKKGHNGVPEFMTYDSIVGAGEPQTKPAPKTEPTPVKEPGEKPAPRVDPRKTPFRNPGKDPKPDLNPKANKEKYKLAA